MKLKTAIAVLIVGLCPAAVWAGAEQDSAQQPQASEQKSSGSSSSSESSQSNGRVTDWQYVNGRAADNHQMQGAQSDSNSDAASAAAAEDSDDAQDQSSSLESGQDQAMGGQSMQLQGIPEGLEDKLVVILPTKWQGSLQDLLAALEQTSQDSEILVLRRQDQDADMSSQDSAEDTDDTSDTSSR
jgi:hypothetical protein